MYTRTEALQWVALIVSYTVLCIGTVLALQMTPSDVHTNVHTPKPFDECRIIDQKDNRFMVCARYEGHIID